MITLFWLVVAFGGGYAVRHFFHDWILAEARKLWAKMQKALSKDAPLK